MLMGIKVLQGLWTCVCVCVCVSSVACFNGTSLGVALCTTVVLLNLYQPQQGFCLFALFSVFICPLGEPQALHNRRKYLIGIHFSVLGLRNSPKAPFSESGLLGGYPICLKLQWDTWNLSSWAVSRDKLYLCFPQLVLFMKCDQRNLDFCLFWWMIMYTNVLYNWVPITFGILPWDALFQ